jgi:hypothetical protein
VSGKTTGPCAACRELGRDKRGVHLVRFASGKFGCAAFPGDKEHRRRIFELMPELDRGKPLSGPCLAPRPRKRKPLELLPRIKRDYAATGADLWEESPIRCDADLDDAQAFLNLFSREAVLWIAPDYYASSKPEHARFFRTREDWQRETFNTPGTRICPASFKTGSYSRSGENVAEHHFAVIESDKIGDGELYADKDEFCALVRWLREACGWHLTAVVDSGGKSLHAWFRHPGATDMALLAEHTAALGLDSKFAEPSQPWRLPGVKREGSDQRQRLVYLEGIL